MSGLTEIHGPHELFETEGFTDDASTVVLDATLTFADANGAQFGCQVQDLLAAFRALAAGGYLPDPGGAWPGPAETTYCRHGDGFCGLVPMASGDCAACGAECHAVFQASGTRYLLERWSVMTTVLILIDAALLPKLPLRWYRQLERCFEQVCQTGRHHVAQTRGEVGRV